MKWLLQNARFRVGFAVKNPHHALNGSSEKLVCLSATISSRMPACGCSLVSSSVCRSYRFTEPD
jgi:hypothetical protein